jgi:hypothetical protein
MRYLKAGAVLLLARLGRVVQGKALRWEVEDGPSSCAPARETSGAENRGPTGDDGGIGIQIVPTPAPEVMVAEIVVGEELRRRQLVKDDQVCGFLDGERGERKNRSISATRSVNACKRNPVLDPRGLRSSGKSTWAVEST